VRLRVISLEDRLKDILAFEMFKLPGVLAKSIHYGLYLN
jgi:hypothetical protein